MDKLDALKTGMMGNERNDQIASEAIKENQVLTVVVDPVIACKGTAQVFAAEGVAGIKHSFVAASTDNDAEFGEAWYSY